MFEIGETMSAIARYSAAWGLTLAPVFLIISPLMLAGMGPCAMAHPEVMVIAFPLFAGLEIAALPRVVRAAGIVARLLSQ